MSDLSKQKSMDQILNENKKAKEPPVTELTAVDASKSSWKVPNGMLLDVAIREVFKLTKKNDVRLSWFGNTYNFGKMPKEDTILATNYDCPACNKRHSASIHPDSVVIRCKDTHVSVFISPTGQSKIKVQCPNQKPDGSVCGKEHKQRILYNIWKSMKKEDKYCPECKKTAVAPEQKKVTRRAKKETTTESSLLGNELDETEYKIGDFSEDIPVKRYHSSTDPDNHYFITSESDLDSVFEQLKTWYSKLLPQLPKTPDELRIYLKNPEKGCVWGVSAHNKRLNVISYPITDLPATFAINIYECDKCSLPFEGTVHDSIEGIAHYCQKCSAAIEKEEIKLVEQEEKFVDSFKKDNGTRVENTPRGVKQLSLESFVTLNINLDKLKTSTFQFREDLDEEHIQLLMQSMIQKRKDGSQIKNIEPIIVRQIPDTDTYEILSGHHRVAAAEKASMQSIKYELMSVDDVAAVEIAIISNFTRKELTPLEEARALNAYQEATSYTQQQIADKLGKSQQWISSRMMLLNLNEKVQESIVDGSISLGHVKAISGLDEKDQKKVIKQAAEQQLSVREVEEIVTEKKDEQKEKEKVLTAVDLLLTYIDEHPELQDKIISRSRIWQDAKIEDIYDIYIGDLLESAKLDDYCYRSSNVIKQFTEALKEKGLTVIDGEAKLRRLEAEETFKQNLQKEEKKKKDLCKYCEIPHEIIGKKYCPFSKNISKDKISSCKYSVDTEESYGATFSEEIEEHCFLCKKKFEPKDLLYQVHNYRKWYVHSSCRFNLIKVHPSLRLEKCADCKKRGNCDLQDDLLSVVNEHTHAVLSLEECKTYISQDEPDSYTLQHQDYTIILDGVRSERGELSDIAKFVTKHNIDLKHISAAEDAESEATLKLLKEAVKTIDSWQNRFKLEVKDETDDEGDLIFLYNELELEDSYNSLEELKEDLESGHVSFSRDQIDIVGSAAEDIREALFKRYTLITKEDTKSLVLLDYALDKEHLFKDSEVLENFVNKNEISKENIHPETEDERKILLAITWHTESETTETSPKEDHDLKKTINSLTQPHKIHVIVMNELDAVGMRQQLYPAYSKQALKLRDLDKLRQYSLETITKAWNLSTESEAAETAVSS